MATGDKFYGFDLDERRTLLALGVGTSETSLQAQLDAVVAINTAQATSITNLNAWATALATKLNADAGVTDTDYDTDPQA